MSDAPDDPLPPHIQDLEREVSEHPEYLDRYSELLSKFLTPELYAHPRRIELILDFVSRFPRSSIAHCPFAHPDPTATPEGFRSVEALWLRLRSEHPGEPDFAIGHAALVANDDRTRSTDILRAAITLLPDNAALWTELGRTTPEPSDSLDALLQARSLGSDQPNVLVWIGQAAVAAGRADVVFSAGTELVARARQTRDTVESPIPWDETGRAAWKRIQAALSHRCPDPDDLHFALAQYANDTHWGHTFLGLAAAEQNQQLEASKHLLSSSKIWAEFRIYSYGPSFLLAQKLCDAGLWNVVEQYLIACKDLWDNEILDDWLADVRNERDPGFDEP